MANDSNLQIVSCCSVCASNVDFALTISCTNYKKSAVEDTLERIKSQPGVEGCVKNAVSFFEERRNLSVLSIISQHDIIFYPKHTFGTLFKAVTLSAIKRAWCCAGFPPCRKKWQNVM